MSYKPQPGDVICYDYLWRDDEENGKTVGAKDRPCAIVVTVASKDGSDKVFVAAITHTPPSSSERGIEIPVKVAKHLGLDDERSWIKTHELNYFKWEEGRLPVGVIPIEPDGKYVYGSLPDALNEQLFSEIKKNLDATITVNRD